MPELNSVNLAPWGSETLIAKLDVLLREFTSSHAMQGKHAIIDKSRLLNLFTFFLKAIDLNYCSYIKGTYCLMSVLRRHQTPRRLSFD